MGIGGGAICRVILCLTQLILCYNNNNGKKKNPHLNFLKGTVLGDKEQGVGIRDKG